MSELDSDSVGQFNNETSANGDRSFEFDQEGHEEAKISYYCCWHMEWFETFANFIIGCSTLVLYLPKRFIKLLQKYLLPALVCVVEGFMIRYNIYFHPYLLILEWLLDSIFSAIESLFKHLIESKWTKRIFALVLALEFIAGTVLMNNIIGDIKKHFVSLDDNIANSTAISFPQKIWELNFKIIDANGSTKLLKLLILWVIVISTVIRLGKQGFSSNPSMIITSAFEHLLALLIYFITK